MTHPVAADRREGRGPTLVNSALTVAVLLLVATLAFTTRQPPPPSIAEFAPQAQQQIRDAPLQQSSDIGSAKGGVGGEGGEPTTTTLTPEAAATSTTAPGEPEIPPGAAVHRCFGDPPRQIPDTQSPPCVPFWSGDNGGATSRGVTGNEIRIAVHSNDNTNGKRVLADLQAFFNRYFEFYGRRISFVPIPPAATDTSPNPDICANRRAQGDSAVALNIFASISAGGNGLTCYGLQVASKKVIYMEGPKGSGQGHFYTQQTMNDFAPYLWEYPLSYERQFSSMGAMICAQLAKKRAEWAPDPRIAARERRFGLIFWAQKNPFPYKMTALENALAKCGASLAAQINQADSSETEAGGFPVQAVLAMKSAEVTTTICMCSTLSEQAIPAAASNQGYFPEWILSWDNDFNGDVRGFWGADQQQAVMGMSFLPRQVPYHESTLNWALNEVDPGFQLTTSAGNTFLANQNMYWNLLSLASGIQMAGPNLTPQTFERGLHATEFPNPYSPQMEGRVDLRDKVHSFTRDATLMWWSPADQGPYADDPSGTWCYVDGGRRFTETQWPTEPKLFQRPCNRPPPPPPG